MSSQSEPSSAEPSSKQIDVDSSVTAEPAAKAEPSPASEPTTSAEPSAEVASSEESTAEPEPSSSETTKKSGNKNGKVLSYDDEPASSNTTPSSIERKDDGMDNMNKDSVESSTARKQQYTYDFVPSESPAVREEKTHDQQEHSSNTSEQTIMRPFQQMPVVEGSTVRSSTEQPAPVTEDLSDDTPMPTGSYFRIKSTEQRTEVNVMDGNVTPASVEQTSPTIYSTAAPIKLQYDDNNSQPAIRVVPVASSASSSDSPAYSVTENISEQSPFLPENENGETVLNILHTPHDDDSAEPKAKSLNIDDDDSLETDDENSISDHEITPKKVYKVQFPDNETTVMKEIDSKTEEVPSDSTEMYTVQESRTHSHDNVESTKMHEKQSSEETMEISHMQMGGAVPTTIIPVNSDHNDDSMEMEPMTDLTDLMSMISGKKLAPELSSSSSSATEESTETLMVDQTTYQARNPMKGIDAISSTEVTSTEHSKEEQIVSSSSEASNEQIPSAEPTPTSEPKVQTASQSSEESELTTIRVEQTVSAVSVTNHTETKNEIITTTSGVTSEISATAEPTLSLSNTDEKTPPLNDTESMATKANEAVKSDVATTTTENASAKSSSESMTEVSTSAKLAESEVSPSAEPTPSGSTETAQNTKNSEMDLKVIPLHTSRRPDRDDTTIKDDSQSKSSSEEEDEAIESTTGHFLSQATFQPSNKPSVGTSLKSSDKDGNDTTRNDYGPDYVSNDENNSTNVSFNDSSSSTSPAPMPNPNFVGYTRCTAGQFECLNGTSIIDGSACISLSQRCDAIAHCR